MFRCVRIVSTQCIDNEPSIKCDGTVSIELRRQKPYTRTCAMALYNLRGNPSKMAPVLPCPLPKTMGLPCSNENICSLIRIHSLEPVRMRFQGRVKPLKATQCYYVPSSVSSLCMKTIRPIRSAWCLNVALALFWCIMTTKGKVHQIFLLALKANQPDREEKAKWVLLLTGDISVQIMNNRE